MSNSSIWPINQVLPLRARVDLKSTAMKRYYAFNKALRLEPHQQSFNIISSTLFRGWYYPSLEMQLAYYTAPAGWAVFSTETKLPSLFAEKKKKKKKMKQNLLQYKQFHWID